jgi:hypothetical protein
VVYGFGGCGAGKGVPKMLKKTGGEMIEGEEVGTCNKRFVRRIRKSVIGGR